MINGFSIGIVSEISRKIVIKNARFINNVAIDRFGALVSFFVRFLVVNYSVGRICRKMRTCNLAVAKSSSGGNKSKRVHVQ